MEIKGGIVMETKEAISRLQTLLDTEISLKTKQAIAMGIESLKASLIKSEPNVDLEEEVRNYMEIHHLHIKDGGRVVFDNGDSPNFMCDIRDIARHFWNKGYNAIKEK